MKKISPRSLKRCLFLREAAGLSFFFYQMHRDTKLHELIGERSPQLLFILAALLETWAQQQMRLWRWSNFCVHCFQFASESEFSCQRKTQLQTAKTASLWEIRFRRCSDHEGACTRGGRVGAQPHSPRPSFCCKAEINSAAKSRNALNISKSTDRNIMNHYISMYYVLYYYINYIIWKDRTKKQRLESEWWLTKAFLHHEMQWWEWWQILPNLGGESKRFTLNTAESMKVEFLQLSFVYLMIFLELQVLLFVRILQHARLQTHFKYSTIPEMCFFTWGFQLDNVFL